MRNAVSDDVVVSFASRDDDQPMTRKLPIGVTAAPFIRSGPAVALELARCADRLGYDSFWVAEVVGAEAFSVLGAAAQVAPSTGLGTGVLPMQVRTPALLAMAAATLQAMAPDREILIGLGVSSPVVASGWHGAV
jgi:alkanesulfonate monooxygenase SsuD/methylene tetrahydromethanopterin reductase-like flavin-dependent oxidoreductase (luciferase family)